MPVKFQRFEKNQGLIYSRRYGCLQATGDTILILDSHVEVKPGFLEPLLQVVDANYKAVAAPIFDFWDTFKNNYWSFDQALGFDRYMNWIYVYEESPKNGRNFRSPAIMGGAFVVKKKFLKEIDYFGMCMEGWGQENIELSLKTWFCDGEVLFVACSRVLHFAARRTPSRHGDRIKPAEFWHNQGVIVKSYFPSDIYEEFDRVHNIDKDLERCAETIEANRKLLRKNKCTRNFTWLRRNLMPRIESYDYETTVAHTLTDRKKCVSIEKWSVNQGHKVYLVYCNTQKSVYERVRLTKWRDLRIFDRLCLDWGYDPVKFSACHNLGGNQIVRYNTENGAISNEGNDVCLGQYKNSKIYLDKGLCNKGEAENESTDFVVLNFRFLTIFNQSLLLDNT